jgi:hypothetical protein
MKFLILALSVFALPIQAQEADDRELETRLKSQKAPDAVQPYYGHRSWPVVLRRLRESRPESRDCKEATLKRSGRYGLTRDEDGSPCRIYDLSFPTLETLLSGPVAKLPVQRLRSRDFLNWMDGDYEAVLGRMQDFRADFGQLQPGEMAGWVTSLRFRRQPVSARVKATGLPETFTAAELEIGSRFRFSPAERRRLKEALGEDGVLSRADRKEWERVIDDPEALLAQIRFRWNDLEKVYDVFLEGQFLPVRGPIALVDFSAGHKVAVERILRSLLHSALNQLLRFVPAPAQQILTVVLNDSFFFLNISYEYQLNQLEEALRSGDLQLDESQSAINLLFAGRSGLVSQLILDAIQGRPFDWARIEEAGGSLRYRLEKQREIHLTNMHSRMVLREGCRMTILASYFGVCEKEGRRNLHSLISEDSVLFWRLGAPLLYRYQAPSSVLLQRSASYLLSVGAGLLNLPILPGLSSILADGLRTFATTGVKDEAFLRSWLSRNGEDNAELRLWLYRQNLTPFLPKSEAQEARVVEANEALLRKRRGL